MRLRIAVVTVVLLSFGQQFCSAQGFLNLNFESANVSAHPPGSMDVPTGSALPGWTAFFSSTTNTNAASQIWYDGISLGGAAVSVVDTNVGISAFYPLRGQFSAYLFGGPFGSAGNYSAGISQTGLVPVGSRSLQVLMSFSGSAPVVMLGRQTISMIPLQTFTNCTLYGGDISSLAGQTAPLSFTEPAPTGVPPSMLELDNIVFSSQVVPEPSAFALLGLGSLLVGIRLTGRNLRK
jgi:hypothetical protein